MFQLYLQFAEGVALISTNIALVDRKFFTYFIFNFTIFETPSNYF